MGLQVITKTSPAPKHIAADRRSMADAPLPYRYEDLGETEEPYFQSGGGIIPNYGGHIPRAQHRYGSTHYGGVNPKTQSKGIERHPNSKTSEPSNWAPSG